MQKENTMTVGQWCGQWFIANRPKWNGNTGDGYRNLIYSHIIPSIGSVVLSDLTEQTITDFYDSLQNRGLSARSVWCVHLLLRRCMDEAAREQFIPYNPVRLCQESKAEEYKAAPLRLGQLQRYLNAAEQLGVLPLIYTGLSSGLRQCELITLSWADFYARYLLSKRIQNQLPNKRFPLQQFRQRTLLSSTSISTVHQQILMDSAKKLVNCFTSCLND